MLQEQQSALDEGKENVFFLQRSWNNFKFVWGSEFARRVTHSKIFVIKN